MGPAVVAQGHGKQAAHGRVAMVGTVHVGPAGVLLQFFLGQQKRLIGLASQGADGAVAGRGGGVMPGGVLIGE
ncbi:hypothetical protein D3C84_200840 [compost metagenome]